MKKVLLIGASSAIANATARLWAKEGDALFLVSRNLEHLEVISKDLKVRGASQVSSYCMDVNDVSSYEPMLAHADQELGEIDIVLIAHGTLSDQAACEQSVAATIQEIQTNALSTIGLLTLIANRLEKQNKGVIAVISSVAGDRGRQSNYVYGSAKSMVNTFTSGLRQRLYKSGVSVLTIKPGFVDTPMTTQFKKGLLWAKPQHIAKIITKACEAKTNAEIYAPFFWRFIMLIIKLIPTSIYKHLKI